MIADALFPVAVLVTLRPTTALAPLRLDPRGLETCAGLRYGTKAAPGATDTLRGRKGLVWGGRGWRRGWVMPSRPSLPSPKDGDEEEEDGGR